MCQVGGHSFEAGATKFCRVVSLGPGSIISYVTTWTRPRGWGPWGPTPWVLHGMAPSFQGRLKALYGHSSFGSAGVWPHLRAIHVPVGQRLEGHHFLTATWVYLWVGGGELNCVWCREVGCS
jgi:hypothetical protein